jgi:hypothetical protein
MRTQKEPNTVCGYSSAEIKTFNVSGGNDHFRNWQIPPNSYTEIRCKIPTCEGMGGGMELYSGSAGSIPIETYADDPSCFQTNIMWPGHTEEDYEMICLTDSANGISPVDLGSHFLTFGIKLTPQRVDFYINNTWVSWKSFYYTKGVFDPGKHIVPYILRIGGGGSTLGGGDVRKCADYLPIDMPVDYVRIYQKQGTRAITFPDGLDGKTKVCRGQPTFYRVNYIPGAIYTWTPDSYFKKDFYPIDADDIQNYIVTPLPETPIGEYDVDLEIAFPLSGKIEFMPMHVSVVSEVAKPANPIQLVTNDNGDTYNFAVEKQANSIGYAWAVNGGDKVFSPNKSDMNPGALNLCQYDFPALNHPYTVQVCAQTITPCSNAVDVCGTITIPKNSMGCTRCPHRPGKPKDITLIRMPGQVCRYQISVPVDPNVDSYSWSYDSIRWETRRMDDGEKNLVFGDYGCGTKPLQVFVQAQNENFGSPVLSKRISVPDDYVVEHPSDYENITGAHLLNPIEDANVIQSVMIINMLGQVVKKSIPFEGGDLQRSRRYDLTPGVYFMLYLDAAEKPVKAGKLVVTVGS